MANPFYDHENYPQNGSPGSSAAMRAELQAIETGFDRVDEKIEDVLLGTESYADQAEASAAAALVSENNTAASEAAALVSENNTAASEAAALVSANNSANSAAEALATKLVVDQVYDDFDDRYLGAKAADPTLDNDGNALQEGTLYYNTTTKILKYYNGTVWVNAPSGSAINTTFAPSGNIEAINVQTAIEELDSEKLSNANSQVLTANIANLAVTTPKIADSAVTEVKIATDAVTTVKIKNSNVTSVKIEDDVALPGLGAVKVPEGNTLQRPVMPRVGDIRYNNELLTFEGYSNGAWGSIGGGATGGNTDNIFFLNDQVVTASYTIPTGQNAMTAGAITINDGVLVTIPDNSTWTIV